MSVSSSNNFIGSSADNPRDIGYFTSPIGGILVAAPTSTAEYPNYHTSNSSELLYADITQIDPSNPTPFYQPILPNQSKELTVDYKISRNRDSNLDYGPTEELSTIAAYLFSLNPGFSGRAILNGINDGSGAGSYATNHPGSQAAQITNLVGSVINSPAYELDNARVQKLKKDQEGSNLTKPKKVTQLDHVSYHVKDDGDIFSSWLKGTLGFFTGVPLQTTNVDVQVFVADVTVGDQSITTVQPRRKRANSI